ncbi:hypothetical protein [Thermococcus sp.]|uniref:hypothetical protein n=1 Tax=Thermococcus sp. TaxID=35749 RepID=UPI00257EFEA4|nr:hypothetical protein [Thermococcus sp.]
MSKGQKEIPRPKQSKPLLCFGIVSFMVIILYRSLLSPLFNRHLEFIYGDFSSIINLYSGMDRFNQTYFTFNQHLGAQTLDVNRAFLLESLSVLANVANITDSQIQSIILLISLLLGNYGTYKLIRLFENKENYQSLLILTIPIFYYLNLWGTERIEHFWIWTTYAIFPLFLYLGLAYILREHSNRVYLVLYSLLFSIYGIIPHSFIYLSIIHVFLTIFSFAKQKNLKTLLFALGPFVVYFLLNLPIFLIMMSGGVGYPVSVTLQELTMLSKYGELIKVFSFANNWWPQIPLKMIHSNVSFRVSSIGIFIYTFFLAIISLKNKKIRETQFIILLSLTFILGLIFFVQGTNNKFLLAIINIFKNKGYLQIFAPFREWGKLSILIPSFIILVLIVGISQMFNTQKAWAIMLLVMLVGINVFESPSLMYLNEVYSPTVVPEEYYTLGSNIVTTHKALWIYPTSAQDILGTWRYVWNTDKAVSSNLEYSIGSEYNRDAEFVKLLSKKEAPENLLDVLNIKYVIYRTDILGASGYRVNYSYLQYKNFTYPTLYENAKNLSSVSVFSKYALSEPDGKLLYSIFNRFIIPIVTSPNALNNSDIFITSVTSLPEFWLISAKNYHTMILTPSSFSYEGNPSQFWSKASTSDPVHIEWHPFLDSFGIENWQSDYGKGLIFTWAMRKYPKKLPEAMSPIYEWNFESKRDIEEWSRFTPDIHWGVSHEVVFDDEQKALKVELWGSSWGWKTINSPLIPADPSKVYRVELKVKGMNAHEVHIKIFEFDENRTLLSGKYITGVGSGTFDWKTITFDYQPENENTRYLQLQIWHGHETDKPLPNIIWIDDVKVYDITNYTKPVTLEIPFEVDKTDNYRLFIRYFKNQKGGSIRVYLDETPIYIKTRDQLNKFVWEDLGAFKLEKGKHKILLENVRGFNAVNLFALVPETEYQKAREEIENLLQNKTVIYIFEAESDLYRENSETIKDFNASNGEAVKFKDKGKAWQTVEIAKNSTYKLALKGKGIFNVSIGNQSYVLTLSDSTFSYTPEFYLKSGEYRLEITPLSEDTTLDVVWLYSTNNNETLEELFQVKEKPAQVQNYTKINPTLWKVKVNATKPFMLTFAESYDPLWEARVYKDGKLVEKVSPVPVYGVINGFWINQTGELEIVLRYTPQDWFERGLIISLTTFILSILYIIYDWRREKGDKWAKRLEEKFKKIRKSFKR